MNEFKKLRLQAKLTQKEMSERMQIPKRTIENWENGVTVPPDYVARFVLNELKAIIEKQG